MVFLKKFYKPVFQIQGIESQSCPKNKYSSNVQILENATWIFWLNYFFTAVLPHSWFFHLILSISRKTIMASTLFKVILSLKVLKLAESSFYEGFKCWIWFKSSNVLYCVKAVFLPPWQFTFTVTRRGPVGKSLSGNFKDSLPVALTFLLLRESSQSEEGTASVELCFSSLKSTQLEEIRRLFSATKEMSWLGVQVLLCVTLYIKDRKKC